MKNNKIIRLFILLSLLISMVACSNKANRQKEDSFSKLLPISMSDMNDDIKLSLPGLGGGIDRLNIDEFITLELNNQTNEVVVFPADYGLKMYLYNYEDEKWIKVKNLAEYNPEGNPQVFPIGDSNLSKILISALPGLDTISDPIDLRVVVIGTIYHEGIPTDKQVGAYIDITLQP